MPLQANKILFVLTSGALLTTVLCVYNISMYQRLINSDQWNSVVWRYLKEIPDVSLLHCGGKCLRMESDCQAFAINRQNYDYCVLLGEITLLKHKAWTNTDGDWSVYYVQNKKLEIPIFRVSAGTSVPVYISWMTETPSNLSETSTSRDLDLSSPLTSFYKHPLVDDWDSWNIEEVTLSLYTNLQEVVRLRFSGSGTSKTSWFSVDNLLSSPWTDLDINAQINYFTISLEDHFRQFYINSQFGICFFDKGWLVVLDGPDKCSWTSSPRYPAFRYALGSQKQSWTDASKLGNADDLVISVLLQL